MASESLIGKLVADRYRISRRLGAGGMGTVYVAVQEPLGREVALKVVRRELAKDPKTLERFRREAMSLSQAHHPHIVALYDFGELDEGALYLAMELVKGDNLRQRLIKRGSLPLKTGVAIVRQCCAALACAHGLGIIHRDLKPENILVMDASGTPDFVKIVDFGVAKLTGIDEEKNEAGEKLTASGSVVGTPGYIAPEVSVRGVTTDPRSDLYALGAVWFECVAGRPPFSAPTATALLMAHAVDPLPPLPSEVPLPVAGLIQRLLAKEPDDRPDDAEELARLLDQLQDQLQGVPSGPIARPDLAAPGGPTLSEQAFAVTLTPSAGQAPASAPSTPPEAGAAPAPLSRRAPTGPLLAVAGALLGATLAWWFLRDPEGRDSEGADAGVPLADAGAGAGSTDAGLSSNADDAGAAVDAGANAAVDAGAPPASDAGARPASDAGPGKKPKPKPRPKPKPPDIYD